MTDDGGAAAFEDARPKLFGIAYRMLGSVVEAEDVVGDVALRWARTDRGAVVVPEAWLVATTTRRALDVLRSARLQREQHPGVWLPEPIATDEAPGDRIERAETLTMGFLLLLERLTPIERAVLVLHDVLDLSHHDVAVALGRSEPACRQALHRARRHVTVPARRTAADHARAAAVTERFFAATASGDVDALIATLAPDVLVTSDGGGRVHAAMRPVVGPARAARYIGNLALRYPADVAVARWLNDSPALVLRAGKSWVAAVCEVRDDAVVAVHFVVDPVKLERLVATLPQAVGRPGVWATDGRFRHRGGVPVR